MSSNLNQILISIVLLVHLTVGSDWWENGNFYQIYPRSFKDSNGDGVGDLKGITEKLSYLADLGITGTWLSPIFKSPMADFGYDISDYTQIQPEYGSMADFENLVKRCTELGIKLILDFVPNHTSDEHEWFQKSIKKDPEYKDFYIWHPGRLDNSTGKRLPPNNWISIFRYSAWEWNPVRQEYYLHQFVKQQPDLNYRNPKVVDAMKNVLRYWLGKGISGFRIDAVPCLFEVEADVNGNYPDEPRSGECDDPDSACYLNHIYTQNRNETIDMVYQWHDVMLEFSGNETKILMTEAYSPINILMQYYGNGVKNGSQIPFNFELLSNTNSESTAFDFYELIYRWLDNMPKGVHANWVLGNHDQKRISTRLGIGKIDLINILLKTLPGITITYNGEEIGMTDVHISWEDTVDPQACNTNSTVYHENSRDPARTPFQWDDSKNGGFSTANKTWLPVGPDYRQVNVKVQQANRRSHLKVFKKLLELRNYAIQFAMGTFQPTILSTDVLVYTREFGDFNPFVIILNFGKREKEVHLGDVYDYLPNMLKVVTASVQSRFVEGDIVFTNNIYIGPEIGVILTTV